MGLRQEAILVPGGGAAIYAFSVLLVGTLLFIRLMKPANAQSRAHPRLAVALVLALAVGTFWALLGPFQPGWYAHTNTVNVNVQASRSASTSHAVPSPQVAFPQSFTGTIMAGSSIPSGNPAGSDA